MSRDSDLAELHLLTKITLDAALADLKQAATGVEAVRRRLRELDAQARLVTSEGAGDGLRIAKWQAWAARQKSTLFQELAQSRAVEEQLKRRAQIAFGRHQAIQTLQAEAKADAHQNAARRAAYAG